MSEPIVVNPLKIQHPIFEVTLPIAKKKVSCRPWTMKEERILLGAKESGTREDIALGVQQIVRNCILDKDFDTESLTNLDLSYVFLRVRSESVGNKIKVDFICNNVPDGQTEECGGEFAFDLDLKKIEPSVPLIAKFEEIELTPTHVVKFRYPKFEKLRDIKSDDDEFTATVKQIIAVVDYVAPITITANIEEISFDEMSVDFVKEFIDSLTPSQFKVLEEFIEGLPEMVLKAKAVCPKCGFEHEANFDNLSSFF